MSTREASNTVANPSPSGEVSVAQPGAHFNVPKLTGRNYLNWKSFMTDIIELKGFAGAVFQNGGDATLNLQAKILLKSSLDDAHLSEVRNLASAYEIWNYLSRMCLGTNSSDVATLVNKFYGYKYQPGDSIETHLEKLTTMREQLNSVGQMPTDEVFIDRIMQTLPSDYDSIKTGWLFMHKDQKTVLGLKVLLTNMQEKIKASQQELSNQAFMVNRGPRRGTPEHIREQKRRTTCGKCGRKGHWAKECRTRPENYVKQANKERNPATQPHSQPKSQPEPPQQNRQAPQASTSNQDSVFLVGDHDTNRAIESKEQASLNRAESVCGSIDKYVLSLTDPNLKSKWIADSGASCHICNNAEWFTELKMYDDGKTIAVGDNRSLKVIGVGTVETISQVGETDSKVTIKDALLVPSLATNIISIGILDDRGFVATFGGGKIQLTRKSHLLAEGIKLTNNLYLMNMRPYKSIREQALLIQTKRTLEEWHKTLGHASVDRVRRALADNNLEIKEADDVDEADCFECPPGKARHCSHPSSSRKAESVGDRVFVDLSGPLDESINQFRYFLVAKDEYSTLTFVYCLRDKAKVDIALAKLFAEFEIETGKRIMRLHSDNGSEFINNKVELLLAVERAVHETSAVYTPQQNGCVEREIQSIAQMARTMLLSSEVPNTCWDEAIKTACFIRNRLPNKRVPSSPLEIATGRRPQLSHLCEFGRQVHIIIDGHHLKKFDPRTEEGFIVGFTMRSNTYRVYLKEGKRVIETPNVIFKKHKPPNPNNPPASQESDLTLELPDGKKSPLDKYFEELAARGYQIDDTFEDAQSQLDTSQAPQDQVEADLFDEQSFNDSDISRPPYSPLTNNESDSDVYQQEVLRAMLISSQDILEPSTYKQAITCSDSDKWLVAIEEELAAHALNGTWRIVDRPGNRSLLSTKWVFKVKTRIDGSIERFKARLVARGFQQRPGLDFQETFAPVAKYETIRTMIAIAAQFDLSMKQFDVTTAFLYGTLEEEVYVQPPEGMQIGPGKALRPVKGLYGLKQAPRVWNNEFNQQIGKLGFDPTKSDHCLFKHRTKLIYICLYVDDGLIIAQDSEDIDSVLSELRKIFNIREIEGSTFVGLQIERVNEGFIIHQEAYANAILERFRMHDSNPVSTPLATNHRLTETIEQESDYKCPYREAVGSILYLATKTRPDILFAINLLARFCEHPKERHWLALKRLMRYIKGTSKMCLFFQKNHTNSIEVFSDADHASDTITRKSITGTIIKMARGPIVFRSYQQGSVAQSTTEAEFVAAAEAIRDLVWLRMLLGELGIKHDHPQLNCDSQSAIRLIRNPEFPKRSKHIDIKYHYIRDCLEKQYFSLAYISTSEQVADYMTKALPGKQLDKLLEKTNVKLAA